MRCISMYAGIPALVLAFLLSAPVGAASATPADLPQNAEARAAIDTDPAVTAAQAGLKSARVEAELRASDPYEWVGRFSGQVRRLRNGPTYGEWNVGAEKTLRWPGKAALDRRIGTQDMEEWDARAGDAQHQSSRDLLNLWLDWLGAIHANKLHAMQRKNAEDNVAIVTNRFRAGDAAKLDISLAQAELAELRRAESASATLAATAWARLHARYPNLVQRVPDLAQPRPVTLPLSEWETRIFAHSHELRIAEARWKKSQAIAERERAERRPDPTVGAYVTSEFGGSERIIGANLALPLSGKRRALATEKAMADARISKAEWEVKKRQMGADIAAAYANAQGSYESWSAAEDAAKSMNTNALLVQKAYSLGEADLQSLLLARRQAIDSARTALQTRLAALRAQYLLLVDAHQIWDMEESDH